VKPVVTKPKDKTGSYFVAIPKNNVLESKALALDITEAIALDSNINSNRE